MTPSFRAPEIRTPTSTPRASRRGPVNAWTILGIGALVVAGGAYLLFMRGETAVVNTGANDTVEAIEADSIFPEDLAGYDYMPETGQLEEQIRGLLDTTGLPAQTVQDFAFAGLTQGGQPAGGLVVVTIPPELMSDAAEREDISQFETNGQTAELESMDLDGFVVYKVNVTGMQGAAIAYMYENAMVLVFAADDASALAITRALVNASPG